MRSKPILLIIVLVVPLLASTFNCRPVVISLLMVDTSHHHPADLLVLLEGGSLLYTPTRERLNKTIELYKATPTNILVCANQKFKQGIINFMVSNGVRPDDIVESSHAYGARDGTYNNVMEIMSALKSQEQYNTIELVTSPYHERRVQTIFSNLISNSGISRPIHIEFRHIEHSDVYTTNTHRYLRIVSHEMIGLLAFYIQQPFRSY